MKRKILGWLLSLSMIASVVVIPTVVKAEIVKDCLENMPMIAETHYTGNVGDSRVFNLNGQGLNYNGNYSANGNIAIDGTECNNGFEVWLARWNFMNEISYASATFKLDGKYKFLTGKTHIIKNYRNFTFGTNVYFYDGERLLVSYTLTPNNYTQEMLVNVEGVNELKVLVRDNIAKAGGTSFALYDMFLYDDYASVPVQNVDANSTASKVEYQLDSLLSSVTLCDTVIKGPTFDLPGKGEICPLQFDAKAVLDLTGLSKNITINKENKSVHVILGKLNKNGSASVVQTTDMCDASWSEQYNDIKDLYKTMTGYDMSSRKNWNRFEKMKGELNRFHCDMFIEADMSVVAYLDFDFHTGELKLREGGIIQSAELGVNLDYPLVGKAIYATLGLKGSEVGTIRAEINDNKIQPYMSIKPAITAKAEITADAIIAKATGGVNATLAVLLQTFSPNLQVTMSGDIYLKASILNKDLVDWNMTYLNAQLYPEFKELGIQVMSLGDTDEIYADAKPMSREYLYTPMILALDDENVTYRLDGVYPDNFAQLARIDDNTKMLLWTGDDGTKSDINRTSMFYSICTDGVWNEPQKVYEDGTATGEFKAVSENGNVYVVFQKLNEVLSDDTEVEEMMSKCDLYAVKYSNGVFSEPVCVNNYDNNVYEHISSIYVDDNNLKIAWTENTDNDIFLSTGTTSIKTADFEDNSISVAETVTSVNASENKYPGEVHINSNGVYYALHTASVETNTAKLYLYDNSISTEICNADGIYNIRSIDDTLYYIKDSTVYVMQGGTETETATGINGVSGFEIVTNGSETAMLSNVLVGSGSEVYISTLQDGAWSDADRYTDLDKYIRSYSPIMHSNGNIELAVSASVVNEIVNEGDQKFGTTSVMVLNQCDYFDMAASCLYYDDNEVKPNSDITLYYDITNDSKDSLDGYTVKLTDENGTVLVNEKRQCDIAPYETETESVVYHLPESLSTTKLNLEISTDKDEKDYSNNSLSTEFGYSNVSVLEKETAVDENNDVKISATVTNTGYDTAENVIAKVYKDDTKGEVLNEINIGALAAGESDYIEYTYSEDMMVPYGEDVMNAVYIETVTTSIESDYADNGDKVVFETSIPKEAGVENTFLRTFIGEDESSATAILSTVTLGANSVHGIEWEYNGLMARCSTVLTGAGSLCNFGLIIPGLLNNTENIQTVFYYNE